LFLVIIAFRRLIQKDPQTWRNIKVSSSLEI
jgi:hypothetical protein